MKVKYLILTILLVLLSTTPGNSQVINRFYAGTAPTGDSNHAIDAIDGDLVIDGDTAQAITSGYDSCFYVLDDDKNEATSTESPCPRYIRPTSNPGTKSWVLVRVNGYELAAHVQVQESIVFTNASWNCDLDGDGSCIDSDEAQWDLGMKYLKFPKDIDTGAEGLIVKLPDYFDETDNEVVVNVYWHAVPTSGNVIWCIKYRYCRPISTGCQWTPTDYTTECLNADSASTTTLYVKQSTDTSVANATVDAWQGGDLIQIEIYRDGDDGSDTLDDTAFLDGVQLVFDREW